MPHIQTRAIDRRMVESCWLLKHAAQVYSQHGEDGVLEVLFNTIGNANQWCVEFGAMDGVKFSNTCNLIRNHNWSSVQIEGNYARFLKLQENYSDNSKVFCLNAIIGFRESDSLDSVLDSVEPLPKVFDLLVIDIDGNDYHVWDSLKTFRPRVVVIEFNPGIPNDVVFVQDSDWKINQGSSLLAFVDLARRKGYELCAVVGANAFFVVKQDFAFLNIADNSVDAMFLPRSYGRLFLLYDGTLVNCGLPTVRLRQKNPRPIKLDPFQFQVYADSDRGYGGAVYLTQSKTSIKPK